MKTSANPANEEKQGVIIFDLDDTLVEKEIIFVNAQRALLQALKVKDKEIDPEKSFKILREIDHELVRLHYGNHSYDSWRLAEGLWLNLHEGKEPIQSAALAFKMKKNSVDNPTIFEAADQHDKILKETIPKIRPGVTEVLASLKKRYVLVLFSSCEKETQKRIINNIGFNQIFDAIIITKRKNVSSMLRAKEKGEIILKKLGGKPKRMVMVGDRISQDIIPAKIVGLETIWIPGPYYPGNREEGPPDHEIYDFKEVEKILA